MKHIDAGGKVLAHLDRMLAVREGRTPPPVTVEWDLSNVCSLGCHACHFAHTHVAGPWAGHAPKPDGYTETGRLADTSRVIASLWEMAGAGVRGVVWSGGGEPTLHPDCEAVLEAGHRAGLAQGMYTLGGHIPDARAAVMARCLSWAVVSLDAETADVYAREKRVPASRFDDACTGIARLVSAGVPVVGVSYLLQADNWRRMHAMRDHAMGLGATYVTFRPVVHYRTDAPAVASVARDWMEEAWDALTAMASAPSVELDLSRFAAYQHWSGHGYQTCHGAAFATMITPDGRVWACPNKRGIPSACLGDITDEPFSAIWARRQAVRVDSHCRVLCRYHLMNQTLDRVYAPRVHEAFV